MTTLLLIDDRELFREGFRLLLATQPDFHVVGEAGAPPETHVQPELYTQVASLRPDVTILGQDVDHGSGATLIAGLVRRVPSAKILLLGNQGDGETAQRALAAGARGFALKQQSSRQVFEALRTVAAGRIYLAPACAQSPSPSPPPLPERPPAALAAAPAATPSPPPPKPDKGPCDNLSRRERDVFALLVRGHTNRRIAGLLGISPKTVETHRAHVLRKLGVHSIVDLVRFAARHQLPLD
jgi:two-component system, NarL family, response regulator NreC